MMLHKDYRVVQCSVNEFESILNEQMTEGYYLETFVIQGVFNPVKAVFARYFKPMVPYPPSPG